MRLIFLISLLLTTACTTRGQLIDPDDTGVVGLDTDTDIADTDTAIIDSGELDSGADTGDEADFDNDGYTDAEGDCDDTDDEVNPDMTEVEYNGVDDDCDASTRDDDIDNDGFLEEEDCDDTRSSVNPYALDLVGDGVDQNCDKVDGIDADADGFASTLSGGDDCDDATDTIHPGATEVWYDGIDQQCDGIIEDDDQDGDGADALSMGGDDCDDTDANVHTKMTEDNSNGVDDNCNGITDSHRLHMTWSMSDPVLQVNLDDISVLQTQVRLHIWPSADAEEVITLPDLLDSDAGVARNYDFHQVGYDADTQGSLTYMLLIGLDYIIWGADAAAVAEAQEAHLIKYSLSGDVYLDDPTAW